MKNYFSIWKHFGFTPEFYDVARGQPMSKREGYPLRPELIESTMYLYQSTSDPFYLSIGKSMYTSLRPSSSPLLLTPSPSSLLLLPPPPPPSPELIESTM